MYLDGSTEKRKRKGTVDVLDYYSKWWWHVWVNVMSLRCLSNMRSSLYTVLFTMDHSVVLWASQKSLDIISNENVVWMEIQQWNILVTMKHNERMLFWQWDHLPFISIFCERWEDAASALFMNIKCNTITLQKNLDCFVTKWWIRRHIGLKWSQMFRLLAVNTSLSFIFESILPKELHSLQ